MNIDLAINNGVNILKNKCIQTAQIDTEILLAKAINKNRKYVILNNDEKLKKENLKYFEKLIKERSSKKPIAYLINKKFFWKDEFFITNDILIPRPDTELSLIHI